MHLAAHFSVLASHCLRTEWSCAALHRKPVGTESELQAHYTRLRYQKVVPDGIFTVLGFRLLYETFLSAFFFFFLHLVQLYVFNDTSVVLIVVSMNKT